MVGTTKRRKPIDEDLRRVLGKNIEALMNRQFAEVGDKPMALAKAAGTSKSQVQRALSGEKGISIDTLSALATALESKPYQLLIDRAEQNYIIDAREIVSRAPMVHDRDEPRTAPRGSAKERKYSR